MNKYDFRDMDPEQQRLARLAMDSGAKVAQSQIAEVIKSGAELGDEERFFWWLSYLTSVHGLCDASVGGEASKAIGNYVCSRLK